MTESLFLDWGIRKKIWTEWYRGLGLRYGAFQHLEPQAQERANVGDGEEEVIQIRRKTEEQKNTLSCKVRYNQISIEIMKEEK